VLEWARRPGPLRVAADQFGSPTYAPHLAAGILELLEMNATGLFHLAGDGCASRWEVAHETLATARTVTADPAAFRLADIDFTVPILPAAAIDFPAPAPRPAFSCLDCGKAARLGVTLPPWQIGLALYITGLLRKHDSAVDIWDRHLPAGCAPTQSKFAAGPGETKGTTA